MGIVMKDSLSHRIPTLPEVGVRHTIIPPIMEIPNKTPHLHEEDAGEGTKVAAVRPDRLHEREVVGKCLRLPTWQCGRWGLFL